jgi:hypothetical protein
MNKLSELAVASPAASWVSMENYRQVSGIAVVADADTGETVTVQLRKATDASGTNAANFGTAVVVTGAATDTDISAIQTEWSQALGSFSAGVPFTHVSATLSTGASPETVTGVVLRSEPRFSV